MSKAVKQTSKVVPIRPGAVVDHYTINPAFQQAFCALLVKDAKVWRALGGDLEPKLMPGKEARLITESIAAIYREAGRVPSFVVLQQYLTRLCDDGKVTYEDICEAGDYILEGCAGELEDTDAVIAQMVPVLKTRMASQFAIDAAGVIGSKDPSKAIKLAKRMQDLGVVEMPEITGDWQDDDALCEYVAKAPRLPTGIAGIDAHIGGGVPQGLVEVIIAGTGIGKGIALIHQAADALHTGRFVLHATLEDPMPLVRARLKANLLGMSVDWVYAHPTESTKLLLDKFGDTLGRFRVKEFEPLFTTNEDIENWVDAEEQAAGAPVHLVDIDYADRMKPPAKVIDYDGKSYKSFEAIYARLGVYAGNVRGRGHKSGPIWLATAAAAGRSSKAATNTKVSTVKSKPLGTDDVSDSMHKTRIAGFVLTLNPVREEIEDEPFVYPYVAKNRLGVAHFGVEPFPMALEQARLCHPLGR